MMNKNLLKTRKLHTKVVFRLKNVLILLLGVELFKKVERIIELSNFDLYTSSTHEL